MPSKSKARSNEKVLHTARFIVAFLALLIAAVHLSDSIPQGSFQAPHTSGSSTPPPSQQQMPSFDYLGFWINLEVIAYTIIAIVFLLGLRTWYVPAAIFNAFNLGIYLLSGVVAIPGITGAAFAGHLQLFSMSLTSNILMVSWIAVLVISVAMLKYDPGSKLDELLVTRRD